MKKNPARKRAARGLGRAGAARSTSRLTRSVRDAASTRQCGKPQLRVKAMFDPATVALAVSLACAGFAFALSLARVAELMLDADEGRQ
jgi:hypothetical protein